MKLLDLPICQDLLTANQEVELSRAFEAGLYAQHLLDQGSTSRCDDVLRDVVQRGAAARDRMWNCNVKLVMKLAIEAACRFDIDPDDLFQEGCLALHEAIVRFDFTKGYKFSTFAHTYVTRHVATIASKRSGSIPAPANRARTVARLTEALERIQQDHVPTLVEVATAAGVTRQVAVRATAIAVELEPELHSTIDPGFSLVEVADPHFLTLLGEDGELLRRRYGIGCQPQTQEAIAKQHGVSKTAIVRREKQALARARDLLAADTCRLAA